MFKMREFVVDANFWIDFNSLEFRTTRKLDYKDEEEALIKEQKDSIPLVAPNQILNTFVTGGNTLGGMILEIKAP
jgi:hypothetical protein